MQVVLAGLVLHSSSLD